MEYDMYDDLGPLDCFDQSRCDAWPAHLCDCQDCDTDCDIDYDFTCFKEHGSTYIQHTVSGCTWSVHESEDGFTYEMITEGEGCQ